MIGAVSHELFPIEYEGSLIKFFGYHLNIFLIYTRTASFTYEIVSGNFPTIPNVKIIQKNTKSIVWYESVKMFRTIKSNVSLTH